MNVFKNTILVIIAIAYIPLLLIMYFTTALKIAFDALSAWSSAAVLFTFEGLTNWLDKP